jgi:gamma-glutamyltranspeptidase / glutathione hydrolase
MHWDREMLHVEPGLAASVLDELGTQLPVHVWEQRNLYFGGAHAAARTRDGQVTAAGDSRRGGVGIVIDLDQEPC